VHVCLIINNIVCLFVTQVNGVERQKGNTKDMIFSIPKLISWVSQYFTLEPGDLLLTGTPAGVGPVRAGDKIECGLGKDLIKMEFKVEAGLS